MKYDLKNKGNPTVVVTVGVLPVVKNNFTKLLSERIKEKCTQQDIRLCDDFDLFMFRHPELTHPTIRVEVFTFGPWATFKIWMESLISR